MRDDRERLLDMLEAIQKIEQYVYDESDSSQNEDLVEVWMIHHLQIVGKAASRVSNELREKHPEVAWGGMIGMRHVLKNKPGVLPGLLSFVVMGFAVWRFCYHRAG